MPASAHEIDIQHPPLGKWAQSCSVDLSPGSGGRFGPHLRDLFRQDPYDPDVGQKFGNLLGASWVICDGWLGEVRDHTNPTIIDLLREYLRRR